MSTYELHPGGVTDTGNVRAVNQDQLLTEGDLVVVADGMGGHQAGEVASKLAVETVRAAFLADPTTAGLVEAVREANRTVWAQAAEAPELEGMGSTVVAVALVPDGGDKRLAVVNVGDSRAYLLRQGQLRRLSSDHSVVADLVRTGRITEEQAATHPHRHILTMALGTGPEVEPHVTDEVPVAGERVLVCSDGLFTELDDSQIAGVLATVPAPHDAAEQLVQQAKAHGGSDNITAVVLDIA